MYGLEMLVQVMSGCAILLHIRLGYVRLSSYNRFSKVFTRQFR